MVDNINFLEEKQVLKNIENNIKCDIIDNHSEEFYIVYNRALNILSYRINFEYELKKKLLNKNFKEEVVDSVITYLKEENLINDYETSKFYIETQKEKLSKMKIIKKLKSNHVRQSIIDDVLNLFDFDAIDDILNIAYKKLNFYDNITVKEINKVLGYLYRNGYSISDINKVKKELYKKLK